jgi:hypothetical protein
MEAGELAPRRLAFCEDITLAGEASAMRKRALLPPALIDSIGSGRGI